MDRIERVQYIIIHHTERNNDFPSLVRLRHKCLRQWDDVGYHYFIGNTRPFTRNGKIYTARPENFAGAHALGYNKNSLGVCLIGNLDKNSPTEKQYEALFFLLEEKIKQYDIPIQNIAGHSELPNVYKSCPGSLVNMNYVRTVLSGKETNYASSFLPVQNSWELSPVWMYNRD